MKCSDCKLRFKVKDTVSSGQYVTYDRRTALRSQAEKVLGPYQGHDWVARRLRCKKCGKKEKSIELPLDLVLTLVLNSTSLGGDEETKPEIKAFRPYLK